MRGTPWSKEESEILERGFADGLTDNEIAALLTKRNRKSVYARRTFLGLSRRESWTPPEDAKILAGKAAGLTIRKISDSLPGRSPAAVADRLAELRGGPKRDHARTRSANEVFAKKIGGCRFEDSPRAARPEPLIVTRPDRPAYRSNLGWAA